MPDPIRPDKPPPPPPPPPPPRRGSPMRGALVVVLLALAAFVAWRLWTPQPVPPAMTEAAGERGGSAPAVGAGPGTTPAAPPSGEPLHPVAPVAEAEPAPQTAAALAQALAELAGPGAGPLLVLDDLVRRVVTTVDNLPRSHAPARTWPVTATAGRFQVDGPAGGAMTIAAGDDARYAPLVALAESIDVARLAKLYARHYPLFQRAYAEIGFPGQHFNDRLVAVIDHLLDAPRPGWPVAITLVEVRSETPSARPWVRYEFADPELEALSAGRKIMIRVGPESRRRLETVLSAFRRQVADGALAGGR